MAEEPNTAQPPSDSPSPSDDFRRLVESVVDYAILMLDAKGRVTAWNPGAEKIKGYKPHEIIGEHFSKFYTEEDLASGTPQRKLEAAAKLGSIEDEGWRVRKDGSRFWASVTITALRDPNGTLRGFGKVTRDLTARHAADEALRRAEQRFHHLVDAVTDYAIFILDPSGLVSTWNVGATRLKGYTADEILGRHFSAFYTPEDRASGKPQGVLDAVRRDGRFEDESWRVRKDGSFFWANVIITALRDPQGQLIGFAKITRDLTSRREAEELDRKLIREQTAREVAELGERQLRESEERYRALNKRLEIVLEGVADGITVQERSGRVVFANTAAAKICGFNSPQEMMDTPPAQVVERFEVLDEDGQPFTAERFPGRRVLAGEPPSSEVLHVRERATGREWWSLVRANAVTNDDGTPELAINIWHDVTHGRRQERSAKFLGDASAALAVSLDFEEMLSNLAQSLVPAFGDWCSVYLLEGDELRHVGIAHIDPTKLAAATVYAQKFPPNPPREHGVWNVIRSGKSELHSETTDESIILAPIKVHREVLGVISLISAESRRRYDTEDVALAEELGRRAGIALENVRLYRAAQKSAKEAEEASRSKDEFLATVSHELRTPLNAILGWSALLKTRIVDPTIAKPIAAIHRNAESQVRIIDDILDVSRVVSGNFRLDIKPSDFVSIAREAIEVVRPTAIARKVEIEFVPPPDCLLVGDPERLQQVVWNLVSNAVKFTAGGGRVRVSVAQEASNVVLSVADTGQGIDPAFLPYVFDRFSQADSSLTRRAGGLGLGLALVRHIVELHGGHVSAASGGVGKGAVFTMTIPIRAVAVTEPDSWPPLDPAPCTGTPLAGIRVLVVDDEPDARELVATVLLEAGAIVETARSAAEGFLTFERFQPHVVVSDLGMPDEDGFTFMRRLRALPVSEGGRTPSLALSALAREEDGTRAIAAGYTTHVGKPVTPAALTLAVVKLVTAAKPS